MAAHDGVNPAVRTIIELNIGHYLRLFDSTADAQQRALIAKLLAEEAASLAQFLAGRGRRRK
jgi:hypothetical protein